MFAGQWTTGQIMSQANWPNGCRTKAWGILAVRRIIYYLTGDACIAERAQTQGKIPFINASNDCPLRGNTCKACVSTGQWNGGIKP